MERTFFKVCHGNEEKEIFANLWTYFICSFCYDEQPLKISEQSEQVVSEIKCYNYKSFNFVKNGFKVKNKQISH